MPCFAHTAAALKTIRAKNADEKLYEAALEDARETLRQIYGVFCEELQTEETIRQRNVFILTRMGQIRVQYPYTVGKVTGKEVTAKLCGEEQAVRTTVKGGTRGLPKATRSARRITAETGASLGSLSETQQYLQNNCGLKASKETERQILLETGKRTQRAAFAGELEARPQPKVKIPDGAYSVPETMVIAVDGKGFRCTSADLKGRNGRNGGNAKLRNANVIHIRRYEYVDRNGTPIYDCCAMRYFVTEASGYALGEQMYCLAEQNGMHSVPRVEYITDGEAELEVIYQDFFKQHSHVVRVLDAMHACQYVDTIVKSLETNESQAIKLSHRLRKRLANAGWNGFENSFFRMFGKDVVEKLQDESKKAWNYLWKRRVQMDYKKFRRRHLIIGSGMVESACKLLIGLRLMGPGMRWRYKNGILIASLRAAMKSHLLLEA